MPVNRILPFILVACGCVAQTDVVVQLKAVTPEKSRVMEHAFQLTDVAGARLAGSPGLEHATRWAREYLTTIGLVNVQLQEAGRMERGWELKRVNVHMTSPHPVPLIAMPMAWSPGTKGTVRGKPVIATVTAEADFEKHRGKLRGRIVLVRRARTFLSGDVPLTRRLTDAELAAESKIRETDPVGMSLTTARPPLPGVPPRTGIPDLAAARVLRKKFMPFLRRRGSHSQFTRLLGEIPAHLRSKAT